MSPTHTLIALWLLVPALMVLSIFIAARSKR